MMLNSLLWVSNHVNTVMFNISVTVYATCGWFEFPIRNLTAILKNWNIYLIFNLKYLIFNRIKNYNSQPEQFECSLRPLVEAQSHLCCAPAVSSRCLYLRSHLICLCVCAVQVFQSSTTVWRGSSVQFLASCSLLWSARPVTAALCDGAGGDRSSWLSV